MCATNHRLLYVMTSGARLGAFSWFSGVAYERPDPVMYAAYVCVRQCFLQKYPFAHCSVSEMVWCNPAAVSMCVDCMALCCVVPIFVSSVAVEGVCAQNFSVFCQSQLFILCWANAHLICPQQRGERRTRSARCRATGFFEIYRGWPSICEC